MISPARHLVPGADLSVHGVRVPVLEEEVSPVIWRSLQSGAYEAKEASCVHEMLMPGDRILELGAGLGIITSVMAKTPNVHIWSFDANPHVVALARRVVDANELKNVVLDQGIFTSSQPDAVTFYLRQDFWMSSMLEEQGPFESFIELMPADLDAFLRQHAVNVLVMDIEGAEEDLLSHASLDTVDRVFLEVHDHLYGLGGIRSIFTAMDRLGFAYDPRKSVGPCVLFQRDHGLTRPYCG